MKKYALIGSLAFLLAAAAAFGQGPSRIQNGGKSGGLSSTYALPFGTDTGTANDFSVNLSPALPAIAATPTLVNDCGDTAARSSCSYSQHFKGDIIIVFVSTNTSTVPVIGLTNTLGYSWLPVSGGCSAAGVSWTQMFYAYVPATTPASDTFTATSSTGAGVLQMSAAEYSGVAQTSPIDGTGGCASGSGAGTFTTASFTGTVGDLAVAGGGSLFGQPTIGSGFTAAVAGGTNGLLEQKIAAGTSITASMVNPSGTIVIQTVAIKAGTINQFGQSFTFTAAHSNTGLSSMTVNGVPSMLRLEIYPSASMTGGEIVAGNTYQLTNDGAEWLLAGGFTPGVSPPTGGALNLAGSYLIGAAAGSTSPNLTLLSSPGNSAVDSRNMLSFVCGQNVGGTGCGGLSASFGMDHDSVFIFSGTLAMYAFVRPLEIFGATSVFSQSASPDFRVQPNQTRGATDNAILVQRPTVGSDGATIFQIDSLTGKIEDTATHCASSASPAVCGSAWTGFIVVPAGMSIQTVNTTALDANSKIIFQVDDTIGTPLGVSCDTTPADLFGGFAVTGRTPGTSFTFTSAITPSTNPLCISYHLED